MNALNITTVLKFNRKVPAYGDIVECEQKLLTIIDGGRPVEDEVRELETLRRTLMALVREALRQMAGPPDFERPFLSLKLEEGEEFSARRGFSMVLQQERGGYDVWTFIPHARDANVERFLFSCADDAVECMETMLRAWTGEWFSELEFQPNRVDS
ncbi:MAG: hypothetical protein HKL90_05225 [Elusimicrobia bacterium]|nr:hypothetical protein [Elusimicrobiota bacterium]